MARDASIFNLSKSNSNYLSSEEIADAYFVELLLIEKYYRGVKYYFIHRDSKIIFMFVISFNLSAFSDAENLYRQRTIDWLMDKACFEYLTNS